MITKLPIMNDVIYEWRHDGTRFEALVMPDAKEVAGGDPAYHYVLFETDAKDARRCPIKYGSRFVGGLIDANGMASDIGFGFVEAMRRNSAVMRIPSFAEGLLLRSEFYG